MVTEYFLSGTEPTESCPLHRDPADDDSWLTRAAHAVGDALGGEPAADDGREEPPPPPRPAAPRPRPSVPVPQRR